MKLYLKESLRLLGKTLPFFFLRIGVYFIISLFFVMFTGIMLFIAFKYSGLITIAIIILTLIGFAILLRLIKRYILYMIKSAHIAVLGEIVQEGHLPKKGMLSYGFKKVKSKFVTSTVFFALNEILHAVVHGISNFIRNMGRMIPLPAVQSLFDLIARVMSIFLNYIDEAILSFIFVHPEENPWKGARDGLVLYFKTWKTLLPIAAIIVVISYVLTFVVIFVSFLLTAPIAAQLPFIFKDIPFLIALFIAITLKVALFDQYTLVAMIVAYQESIKDKSPDSQTMQKLEQMVPKFKEILKKAGRQMSNQKTANQQNVQSKQNAQSSQNNQYVKRLIPYIRQIRNQGYSDAQIRQALINNGWPASYVDAALKAR